MVKAGINYNIHLLFILVDVLLHVQPSMQCLRYKDSGITNCEVSDIQVSDQNTHFSLTNMVTSRQFVQFNTF